MHTLDEMDGGAVAVVVGAGAGTVVQTLVVVVGDQA